MELRDAGGQAPEPPTLALQTVPEDGPGYYVILNKAVVTKEKVFRGEDSVVAKVGVGGLVKVLEVQEWQEEMRVRARIDMPEGWMSLVNTETGRRWAQRALLCNRNHLLRRVDIVDDGRCSACGRDFPEGTTTLRCRKCSYRLCPWCVSANTSMKVWSYQASAGVGVEALGFDYEVAEPEFQVHVSAVEAGSWAEAKGVKVGDELLAANGVRLDRMPLEELESLFRDIRPLELTFLWDACSEVEAAAASSWAPAAMTKSGLSSAIAACAAADRGAEASSAVATTSRPPSAGKLQELAGRPIEPQFWGVSRGQCSELLSKLRADQAWPSGGTMQQLVSEYVAPFTRGTGLSYALWMNDSAPREVNVVVTYSPRQRAEEFLETLLRSTDAADVAFISALSLYQAEDAAGPRVEEQLGDDPTKGPVHEVLQQIAARGRAAGCRWRWRGLLRALPRLLLGLAVALFWGPLAFWGCVPSHDFEGCAARTHPDGGWSQRVVWSWRGDYARTGDAKLINMVLYGTALGLASIAAFLEFAIRVCGPYNGRLIAVPCQEAPLSGRLSCSYLLHVAQTLGVPAELASSLAPVGGRPAAEARGWGEAGPEARLRELLEDAEAGSRRGSNRLDSAVRGVIRRRRWAIASAALYWAVLFALLRSADLRLVVNEPWRWSDFASAPLFCVLGALVGALACTVAAWWLLWRPGVVLRGWALCAAPAVPLALGSGALAALALTRRLSPIDPSEWSTFLDLLSDESFRHTTCTTLACERLVAFSASCAQTLIVGGVSLAVFVAGAFSCPRLLRRHRCACAIMVGLVLMGAAAAFCLVRAFYFADDLPDPHFWHAVVVFHLTQLLARCVLPLGALCAFAATWSLPQRRRGSPRTAAEAATATIAPQPAALRELAKAGPQLQKLPDQPVEDGAKDLEGPAAAMELEKQRRVEI